MEWMLQVVDEIDDLVSASLLYTLRLRSKRRLMIAGSIGIGALGIVLPGAG
jgi:hypothetical protein